MNVVRGKSSHKKLLTEAVHLLDIFLRYTRNLSQKVLRLYPTQTHVIMYEPQKKSPLSRRFFLEIRY